MTSICKLKALSRGTRRETEEKNENCQKIQGSKEREIKLISNDEDDSNNAVVDKLKLNNDDVNK